MRTKDKLAEVLRAEGLNDMATKAQDGYYDDFESPLAMPITQLVTDLTAKGREDLAKRAANGEWDSTKEEAEAWYEREARTGNTDGRDK